MEYGTLYIVATPIGNIKDITYRAVEILKEADIIACEDTRKTKFICSEYGITTRLTSYHDHNKFHKENYLIEELKRGLNIALVSDAGTPGINDPGYNIIKNAQENGIEVTCAPGACAAINAVVLSGFPTDRFCYEGFLPAKKGRQTALKRLENEDRTIVLYESVHRIIKTLEELSEIFPERKAAVLREMTKVYEEVIKGTFTEIIEELNEGTVKGEFVIIISGTSAVKTKRVKVNKYKDKIGE